ncbi:hypothetical protein BV898_03394 [Hypsibius exemplaris]|uniref:Uncharacterized protein n=1 Tax=Hypsibius exemplaris TaxID=2072580 RepID=A0A1W0X4S4_HYPEX|nr:hypothetical protein BV898_03394 [Hypsibius exemplaris]
MGKNIFSSVPQSSLLVPQFTSTSIHSRSVLFIDNQVISKAFEDEVLMPISRCRVPRRGLHHRNSGSRPTRRAM